MSSVFRPSFEVVKEGRILNYVSVYRRLVVNNRINQGESESESQ
jgi:hypothetical protein